MEEVIMAGILSIFGAVLGSFAAASVWRLRARQLVDDKAAGEPVDKHEYKALLPLTKSNFKNDRSRCLSCQHPLAWYDLLPLVSWLSLGGRCRYCRKPIGRFEPLMELGVAAYFVGSYLLWPLPLDDTLSGIQFVVWLIAGVMLAILFAYDLKWFLLPDQIMFPLIGVSSVFAIIGIIDAPNMVAAVASLAGAIAILSGLYWALWHISKGQWIGFGDVKLGLALALLLVDWRLAFIALFGANLIGVLIVVPGMLAGKISRTTRVPFGPLLVAGMLVAMFAGPWLVSAYAEVSLLAVISLLG